MDPFLLNLRVCFPVFPWRCCRAPALVPVAVVIVILVVVVVGGGGGGVVVVVGEGRRSKAGGGLGVRALLVFSLLHSLSFRRW